MILANAKSSESFSEPQVQLKRITGLSLLSTDLRALCAENSVNSAVKLTTCTLMRLTNEKKVRQERSAKTRMLFRTNPAASWQLTVGGFPQRRCRTLQKSPVER
jgi:hypothetical protein